jgi:hypothetical protein
MRLEIKRTIIIGMIMFYAHLVNAQCGNMMSIAQNYYRSNDYANAKVQFQKIVEKCPSNADLAREYIRLCDGYLSLAAQQQNQNRADKSTIDSLNRIISKRDDRIRYLEKDSIPFYTNLLKNARVENDSLKKVTNEQQQFMDSYENEKKVLYGSLRDVGKELNDYLDGKLGKDGKKEIKVICDTTSNDSVVSFMRDNVRLVKKIKTSLFK